MAITRISRLRDCGVFRDFTWPTDLPDFGRYNLIYGWNGSGKTTLSRLFRGLEARTPPTTGQVTFALDGHAVGGDEFAQATLPVRVFNRDFVNESVFPVGGGDVPPIFVVGKESVEKQKEADRLKAERTTAEANLVSARSREQHAERAFDRYCIDRAKVIKDTLQKTGSAYNNYNKTDYQGRAQKMAADGDAASHRLSDEQREALLAQHQATPQPKVPEVTYQIPALQGLADQVAALLQTTVVSSAIQSLRDDSALAEWVRHGLGLHKERRSDKCLFCEQPLPQSRVGELEAHFNAEYERFLRRVDEQIRALESAEKQAAEVKMPNRAELYDDLATDFDVAEQALRQALDAVRTFIGDLVKALNDKKAQPFKASSLAVSVPAVDAAGVDRLNEVIRRHNQACDEFQSRVSAARERLEADFVAGDLVEFVRLRDAVQAAEVAVRNAAAEVERLNGEISRLEREIVEHRQPAEELNEELRKYLGHDRLRLEIKDSGYTITRYGVPAEALSEGEMTALALLYFLKSLQDRRFDLADGVVVLDDPVSSLDANALYLAFGFIRERTQHAAQLLIFTHNFTFFRQVRNWFHHLKGQKKKDPKQRPARFYMLDCRNDTNGRCTAIRPLDPLLENYDSEYQYLFSRIYQAADQSGSENLEDNYALPNMARRLLEAFLAFRQPNVAGELWQKMEAIAYDAAKKTRILRFLHTHSHSNAVGEPEHDPSLLAESGTVLTDLLQFIEAQDKPHYDAMVELVNPPASEEDDG